MRASAVFTDVDLFSVAKLPQPPSNQGSSAAGTQTAPILAADSSAQTNARKDAESQTTDARASTASGAEGEGKGDGDEAKADGGPAVDVARLAAMLRRVAPHLAHQWQHLRRFTLFAPACSN